MKYALCTPQALEHNIFLQVKNTVHTTGFRTYCIPEGGICTEHTTGFSTYCISAGEICTVHTTGFRTYCISAGEICTVHTTGFRTYCIPEGGIYTQHTTDQSAQRWKGQLKGQIKQQILNFWFFFLNSSSFVCLSYVNCDLFLTALSWYNSPGRLGIKNTQIT